MASNRKPFDDLRETVGRLGDQLPRPGLRGVDDLGSDLFGGRPGPGPAELWPWRAPACDRRTPSIAGRSVHDSLTPIGTLTGCSHRRGTWLMFHASRYPTQVPPRSP